MINCGKKLSVLVLLVGIVSLVMSGLFLYQGISKGNMIAEAMRAENITYGGAGSTIQGVIDTPAEAEQMALILKQHREEQYGNYTTLPRDDPNRDQILKAMTMENSLNLAQMGFGLTQVIEAIAAFMALVGVTFIAGAAYTLGSNKAS